MSNDKKAGQQRYIIVLLFVICAGPLLTSWWLLNFTDFGRDGKGVSHGLLIKPIRPLPDAPLFDLVTNEERSRLHGKWNLVYLTKGSCDKTCEENLYKMRQLRLATGKYAQRLQRVLVVFGENQKVLSAETAENYKGQLVAMEGRAEQENLDIQKFVLVENEAPLQVGRIYIIDPLGNLMMAYEADTEPAGIIKDLKRLLKYSQVG